ncbi:hypothetical protein [Segatella copri]|jgi:hypothetical protein|uniref:Uncharacterized protein n=1 Tax=Segatella copri TaxID=165179 RepID=A0AAW5V3Y5_9BACT|nr:hypothetical protein [Segatella copri]MCW4101689.1 hypothetical protein [Segatella copri]MCW4141722.1 hypothetical protein [Segatella copri]MCW4145656.1 hypothetical protein [Segatella copri]MCW4166086.1 hypothetical protein [Segatella copri]
MEHIIAYNPYKNGNKGSVSSQPLSVYDKTIAYPWMADLVAAIRGGNDELKKQLPFRCAHYYQFRDNRRSQKNAVPESFLFQTTIDVDDKEYVDKAIEKARELNCSDTIWNGALLHLEYSARKKLHIDIRMPVGMTIEETQRAYCEALGVPYDESCITPERMLFITDKESEIYRSPHWYEVLPQEELRRRRQAYLDRGLAIDGRIQQGTQPKPLNIQHSKLNTQQNVQDHRLPGSDSHHAVSSGSAIQPAQPCDSNAAHAGNLGSAGGYQIPDGLPTSGTASEKSLIAFDLFTESAGLKNVNIDTEGSRHSSLLAIMSAGASRVMSEEELRRVVAVKMPSFAQERDCQQLIHDFYEKYGDSSKPFSRDVIRINAQAEKQATLSTPNSSLQTPNCEDDYPAPPEMPKKLPKLVELLVSQTPDIYKPAVAHAIFPPLATHLCRTYFNYIDNVEHEATLMCCLLAGTGAGKNCVQMPINLIMEDIRKRDKDNLKREKEWKDEVTRKGANKDKRKRPENLVIQEIDADMTNPAFVMRTAEAQEHFLYTALNEIDQFDNLRGIGNQQFRIMCLAFDPGNQYGQTRVGTQSVTERVTIRFNWNASTTINKGIRYFSKVLTDGPISRINFCTIPEREIGAEMPVYGTYDDTFRENLKPYIEHLNMASGTINCPEAFALAQKLKEENADFARMSQDRVYENLSFRANVIAYLKACVLYVANGCQWESEIEEFVRWSEQYDLYCKMRFFRDAIVKAEQEGVKSSKRGPSNMLQLLPNEFSYQQAEQLRSDLGLDTKGTRRMIATWVFRKYIVKVEAGEQGVNAGNDKADNSHCNYNYGNYSFYRKLCFLKKESK